MTLQEIIDYLSKVNEEGIEVTDEKFVSIINELAAILKRQNEILVDIKNSNIRMENRVKYIENELEKSSIYKNIVDNIMGRISSNPISALIYLYRVRKNLQKMSENNKL